MPNIHPMLIHFPIALIITTFVIDILGIALKNKSLIKAGTVTTAGAFLGAIIAVISGVAVEDSVWMPGVAHEILETHELFGFIALSLIAIIAIIRFAMRDKLEGGLKWLMVILGAISTAVIIYGAHQGGVMVFTHGAAVEAAKNCADEKAALQDKLDKIENESLEEPE